MHLAGGVSSIILSLPHRGRLSLLCDPDLIAFPPAALFSKIKGRPEFDPATAPGATGDVISHLSGTKEIDYEGKKVKVQVLQNPSHLEVRLALLGLDSLHLAHLSYACL
jgi:probable 2-oxoglutarate dehydrogenase E1 component DHKTD1